MERGQSEVQNQVNVFARSKILINNSCCFLNGQSYEVASFTSVTYGEIKDKFVS